MDHIWDIDDVVRTSDDVAVRRKFAQRNRFWLIAILCVFAFASLIQGTSTRRATILHVLLATANLGVSAFGLFLMRYAGSTEPRHPTLLWRTGAWLRARINAVALTFVTVLYTLAMVHSYRAGGWLGWAMMTPILMLGFRMLFAEHLLLHAYLLGGALVMALLLGIPDKETTPMYVSLIVCNLATLGIELFASHRMRKQVADEWGSRRQQAREQMRMRDELRYARELQLSMLPECAPKLPWADICSVSIPATEVGGDYYDYFVEGDRIALVCGDVAGHGMASGLVLSALRSGFTLLRDSLSDPAGVLQRLHDLVAQTTRRRMLVTVSVVLLDREHGRATIASAGHPPVIVRRADGRVETIDLFAPPLGVRLPVSIPQRQLDVAPGDVFVLHSDGVYETRSANGDTYGLERLENIVREHGTSDAESLRDAILRDLAEFRGSSEQDDDVTLVVCRLM